MSDDITKILEQEFADSGGVVGKAYLLDAKADIERLRTNYDLLSDDYRQLLGDNERLREELLTRHAEARKQAEEIERMRVEQNINDQLLKQVNDLTDQIEQMEAWRANIGGQKILDLEAEIERLRDLLSEALDSEISDYWYVRVREALSHE